jgi:YidC/Oxa1 family membrane protein insertase
MDTQRIIALIIFSFTGLLLWEAWQKHTKPPVVPTKPAVTQTAGTPDAKAAAGTTAAATSTIPTPTANTATASAPGATAPQSMPAVSTSRVAITTDTLAIELDGASADIRNVVLRKHFARGDNKNPFTLMQDKVGHYFIAQTGLLGEGLPNHTSKWALQTPAPAAGFDLGTNEKLDVVFINDNGAGAAVSKTYTFKRGSYVVDIRYDVKGIAPANAKAYFQFLRDANPPEGESSGNMFTGVATYTGPAVYTEAKKFEKVAFSDIEKNKAAHAKEASDGWMAMVQHYFVSAWLPQNGAREFFTKKTTDTLFSAGVIVPVASTGVGADASLSVSMPLYLGPQEQQILKEPRPGLVAPGFELVVDYGWLTALAKPMFIVLSFINGIVGNWGWTIIIFTILLKIVFFPLNQKSGKSMAHMKALMPKMEALKARYGDDKMKLNQAMMELYKTEKANPLGGCLPIMVQIPFFIALYWVLLGAVELRNAPWMGWITDLSIPDPFYVLPLFMGVSMFVQSKLNPAPTDPIQAKVMTILPIVFSIMFFFFPAGLVLYWTMQNILGIAQQWYLNKTFSPPGAKLATAKR